MSTLYLIALLPPAKLSDEIHAIRVDCSQKFGVYKALRPPVHITLYPPFRAEEAMEEQLIGLLKQGTAGLPSFLQMLENYGTFKREVIYIKALKSPALIHLHETIVSVIRKNQLDKQIHNKEREVYKPHITIAYRDVSKELFPKIWKEYKDRKFERSFKAEHFTLLKHDGALWNSIAEFGLGNQTL